MLFWQTPAPARPTPAADPNRAVRAAFVMEQTLGHVTTFRNLRTAAACQHHVRPEWLPVTFDVCGAERAIPLYNANWSVRASLRARVAIARAAQRAPLDALLFHTQVTSLFSADLMRRIPSIVSLDATPINYDSVGAPYGHRPAGTSLLDRQKHALNRRALHSEWGLVSWSEWTKESLVNDYGVAPERVRVIAPGAAAPYFEIGQARRAAGDSAGGDTKVGRPVRLLFVGGDFARKGGSLLLEAMRGPLGDHCEAHIVTKDGVPPQRNVHVYHGVGPNSPQLMRLFREADVFVLPTYADCLAIVLMEATAAALPVVTTDVGALREAILPGESGLVVPPGDATALAGALDRLVGDAPLRRAMGRAGHALACERFNAQRNNQDLLSLVAQAARAGRSARTRGEQRG